eukprot:TRINITY_DN4603_c0_g2_i6.p1 TRINITY_DN4603_c0_g2~~TRINITY_DN4603_c0_g2_i6.p1  ORF type:complete len:720 (-),score=230.91 TRINITY_DN4603_c0_g2_i6:227-2386(-)
MLRKLWVSSLLLDLLFLFLFCNSSNAATLKSDDVMNDRNYLITKEERRFLAVTDYGQISAVDINDGYGGPCQLQFITLEPNSLFLPVLLQTDMVFYVNTGRGRFGWVDNEEAHRMEIQKGDIYTIESGSIFYVQSLAEPTKEKLMIYALFTNKISENAQETFNVAYSNLNDWVLGFDKRILQMAFQVSEEVIEGIIKAEKPPSIVQMMTTRSKADHLNWKEEIVEALVGDDNLHALFNSRRAFNVFRKRRDFASYNGWSLTVDYKDLAALERSDTGVFMVNLTKGSMMGPHWNSRAAEIAVVVQGQGMVHMVCSSNGVQCKNTRFRVKEGDVFMVPRFQPMAEISFNDDSLVFMGFTMMTRNNQPQFLAGKRSVFQSISQDILAMAFNIPTTTVSRLVYAKIKGSILECASCAEDEEKKMKEEIEKQRQEEARKRCEEEEAMKRQEEEEARKRKEEEEARKREEEKKRREEENRKRKQEEEAREREKQKKRQEEEEARKRKEEEAKKREEEEKRRQKEEEARRREEEEKKRQKEEEARRREKEKKRQEEEMEEAREREEAKRRQEKEDRKRKEEEEASKREEEEKKRQEEEDRKRKEEEEARKKEEEKKRRQEEEDKMKQEEEARKQQEEEAKKKQEEEEATKRQEEARKREEEERKRQEEENRREEKERGDGEGEKGVWKNLSRISLLALLILVTLVSLRERERKWREWKKEKWMTLV